MAILEDLAPDAVACILSKLPAKVAAQFKLVSRSWDLIISERHFICNYAINKTDGVLVWLNGLLLVYFKFTDAMRVGDRDNILAKHFLLRNRRIGGYCNGLMLVYDHFTMSIWNLAMQKCKMLPKRPKNAFLKTIDLARVPLKKGESRVVCCSAYGLGFDDSSKDYKAIKIHFCYPSTSPPHACDIKIHCLNTNKWKTMELGTGVLPDDYFPGLYLDKFLYWEEWKGGVGDKYTNVLCFNLLNENFVEVPKFSPTYESGLGTTLGYLCIPHVRKDHTLELWILRENNWNQFATISVGTLFGGEVRPWKPLCFTHNGEVVLTMGESLYMFNIKTDTMTWMMLPDNFPNPAPLQATAISYAYGLVDPTNWG